MSAIWVKCRRCGGTYITGMVGMTPWPAHVCPDGTKNAPADLTDPLKAVARAGATMASDCRHENVERVARLYVDGRPLYRCCDCDTHFVYEDDEPSYKGLATLRGGNDGE